MLKPYDFGQLFRPEFRQLMLLAYVLIFGYVRGFKQRFLRVKKGRGCWFANVGFLLKGIEVFFQAIKLEKGNKGWL